MKMIKKLLVCALAVCMLVTTAIVPVEAAVNTPAKIAKDYFAVVAVDSSNKKVQVGVVKTENVTGVELRAYDYSGKKVTDQYLTNDSDYIYYSDYFKISQNKVYKYRVRFYNTDPANGENVYGSWSSYKYFDFANFSAKSKSNKKGFTVTVKKVSGVSKYAVYVKTSSDGKFKKVKTLKNKSYTVRISSSYKKKASNYIKVVPYIKGYGYSEIYTTGTLYVYK